MVFEWLISLIFGLFLMIVFGVGSWLVTTFPVVGWIFGAVFYGGLAYMAVLAIRDKREFNSRRTPAERIAAREETQRLVKICVWTVVGTLGTAFLVGFALSQ